MAIDDFSIRTMRQLIAVVDLLDLRLVEHRGCLIRTAVFDEAAVDTWLESTGGDTRAVESVMNHVHFYDLVDDYDDARLDELEALARRTRDVWADLAALRHPSERLVVIYETEPDEYGPTITITRAPDPGLSSPT